MKNITLITILFLLSCQSPVTNATEQDNKKDDSTINECNNVNSLFPVYGATLGETKEVELLELGFRYELYRYYTADGHNLTVSNGILKGIYFKKPEEFPEQWHNIGFNWRLTYGQTSQIFECLGFELHVPPIPSTEKARGAFYTRRIATNRSKNLQVILNFKHSKQTIKNSEGNLNNMYFSRIR